MKFKFKELTVDELKKGYVYDKSSKKYHCIFCNMVFNEGVIYNFHDKQVNAQLVAALHVQSKHGGSFQAILDLEKDISGLTDIQKKLIKAMHDNLSNTEIGKIMDINISTVRGHKFNLQKAKRQAKIFLSIMEYLEDEETIAEEERLKEIIEEADELKLDSTFEQEFSGNSLHPFFTKYDLK